MTTKPDPAIIIERALAHANQALDAMPRCAGMWGSTAEAVELQALMLLEQRSALGRPTAYWRNQNEVRDAWIAFASHKAGHSTNIPHFCAYADVAVDDYAPALAELIAFVRERLPLETRTS